VLIFFERQKKIIQANDSDKFPSCKAIALNQMFNIYLVFSFERSICNITKRKDKFFFVHAINISSPTLSCFLLLFLFMYISRFILFVIENHDLHRMEILLEAEKSFSAVHHFLPV
jgi:hypothetical protein